MGESPGKLKILWIDDRPGAVPDVRDMDFEGRYFDIIEKHDVLEIARFAGPDEEGVAAEVPDFDIVATDFNLVPAEHSAATPVLAIQRGLRARAAGFLIGLLLSAASPGRPRAVIPYSGDQRQFDDVWKLAHAFAPPWIAVSDKFDLSKVGSSPVDVFKAVAVTFRRSLLYHLRRGACALNADAEALLERWEANPRTQIDGDQNLSFRFKNGVRTISIGALFQDLVEKRNFKTRNAKEVAAFFADALGRGPESKAALKLAKDFWARSNAAQSLNAYRNAGARQVLEPKPFLLEDDGGTQVVVRAVLYCCIRAFVATRSVSDMLQSLSERVADDATIGSDEIRQRAIAELGVAEDEQCLWEGLSELIAALTHLGLPCQNLEQILDALDQTPLVSDWEFRWIRALDPNPKSPRPTLSGAEALGRRVARLLSRNGKEEASAARELLRGRFQLADEDMAIAQKFARQMVPANFTPPPFLPLA